MRHNLGYRKLNKSTEHRKALFKNMLNSLIKYEQITTTLPKAKDLKETLDVVETPLNQLKEKDLCPGRDKLNQINKSVN